MYITQLLDIKYKWVKLVDKIVLIFHILTDFGYMFYQLFWYSNYEYEFVISPFGVLNFGLYILELLFIAYTFRIDFWMKWQFFHL